MAPWDTLKRGADRDKCDWFIQHNFAAWGSIADPGALVIGFNRGGDA
jgi:hypothetical protein